MRLEKQFFWWKIYLIASYFIGLLVFMYLLFNASNYSTFYYLLPLLSMGLMLASLIRSSFYDNIYSYLLPLCLCVFVFIFGTIVRSFTREEDYDLLQYVTVGFNALIGFICAHYTFKKIVYFKALTEHTEKEIRSAQYFEIEKEYGTNE